eukprot:s395_g10.t1
MAAEDSTQLEATQMVQPTPSPTKSQQDGLDALMAQMEEQLDSYQSKEQCSWCLIYKEALEMKHHGKKMTCRSCQAIQQMLYRHLGSSEEPLSDFTSKEQVNFFQEAAATVDLQGGGRWRLLKAVLVEKKAKVIEREQSIGVGSDYVPMSVWIARGWEKEDVLSYDDWEELPNGTKAYRCHIKTKSDHERKRTVEESVLHRERECKKRKVPKTKGKAAVAKQQDEKVQDKWNNKDSGPKTLSAKQLAVKEEKEKKKAEATHLKEVNAKCALSAKAMPALSSHVSSIGNALKQIDKEGLEHFGEEVQKDLKEALAEFELWKGQATKHLHDASVSKSKTDPSKVEFTRDTVDSAVKAVADVMSTFKGKMRVIRERKAAAKAAQPPKATRAKAKAKAKH